jgi:drug/metabolite transporter (DMT)-like permease
MASPLSSKSFAPLYVLIFGILFGTTIAMAKLGAQYGISPLSLVFWQMLVSGVMLYVTAMIKGQPVKLDARHLRYYLLSGILGNALPTTLAFMASIKIGAVLTGLVYPLSPIFTYAFSLILRLDKPSGKKIVGMMFGMMGAAFIVLPPVINSDQLSSEQLPPLWVMIAVSIPVMLALGNVYRSMDWPTGSPSLPLAAGMLLATSLLLLPALIISDAPILPNISIGIPLGILLGNIVMSYVGFIVYFELQRVADPVYFSQISYFITAATMIFGFVVFGETFQWYILPSIILIFFGLYLVSRVKN